jgi:hypothetical protein
LVQQHQLFHLQKNAGFRNNLTPNLKINLNLPDKLVNHGCTPNSTINHRTNNFYFTFSESFSALAFKSLDDPFAFDVSVHRAEATA